MATDNPVPVPPAMSTPEDYGELLLQINVRKAVKEERARCVALMTAMEAGTSGVQKTVHIGQVVAGISAEHSWRVVSGGTTTCNGYTTGVFRVYRAKACLGWLVQDPTQADTWVANPEGGEHRTFPTAYEASAWVATHGARD